MSRKQTRKLDLDKKELEAIRKRIRRTKNRKVADRLRVILLKAEGYKNHVIAHILQMNINSVGNHIKRYLRGGLDALCTTKYQGRQPRLTVEQQESLKIRLKTHIYNTAEQVIDWVEKQFKVFYNLRLGRKAI
jgi:transposase